jgi:hypothetical protein
MKITEGNIEAESCHIHLVIYNLCFYYLQYTERPLETCLQGISLFDQQGSYLMKKLLTATIASCAMATAFSAIAEDKQTVLSAVQAPVMVNQGESYVEATESMFLYPGDRLMVMQGGSAQVQFANGCIQKLDANEIATVSNGEACESMASAGTHNQVGGSGGGGGSSSNTGGLIFAAVVAGGIIYEISDDDDDDDRPPVSP